MRRLLLMMLLLFAPTMLFAADKGGPTRAEAEAAYPAPVSWTGCGVGGRLGWMDGVSDPVQQGIGYGTTGEKVGISGFCDFRFAGSPFVVGAEASYDWMFGDIKTAGVGSELGLGGRAGMLINSGSLVYGYAGWSRLDSETNPFSSGKTANGWKVGPGIELRLNNTPLFIDARVTYGTYSTAFVGSDLHSYDAMVSLKYKFGMGAN